MAEDSSEGPIIASKEDLKDLVSWQQNRFHHLNMLARGTLALGITIIVLSGTLYSAFGLGTAISFRSIEELAQMSYPGLDSLSIAGIVVTEVFLIVSLVALAFTLGVIGASRLIEVVVAPPMEITDPPANFVVPKEDLRALGLHGTDYSDYLYRSAMESGEKISEMERRYFIGTVRFSLFFVFTAAAIQYYLYLLGGDLGNIIWLNLCVLTPTPLLVRLSGRLGIPQYEPDLNPEKESPLVPTIWQEIIHENSDFSRLNYLTPNKVERGLLVLTSLLALLSVAIYGLNILS